MRKTFLTFLVAVFALSTLGVGTANALWTGGPNSTKKICLYHNAAGLASQTADTGLIYELGTSETLALADYITITLSGGALFTATPVTLAPSGAAITLNAVGSPSGLNYAIFESSGTMAAGVGQTLIFNAANAAIFNLSAITGNVDITIKAQKSGSGIVIFERLLSTATTIGKYVFSPPAMCSSGTLNASLDDTVRVAATGGPYYKFTNNVLTGTALTASFLQYAGLAAEYSPAVSLLPAGKVLWTIAGNFSGISSLNASTAGVVTGSTSAGVQTGLTANVFAINTAKTHAYASNTTVNVQATAKDPKPQFVLDGTTSQTAREFTAQIDILADTTTLWTAHVVKPATTFYRIVRDGFSFGTNSLGTRNWLKITDRSGNLPVLGGSVIITAWDAAGNSIPESSSATALKLLSNQTLTVGLTGTELAARFPTGTPVRYEFAVESANATVTNVKQSTDATTTSTTVYTNGAGAI